MFAQHNDSEELGLKVQRAQHKVEQIRGVGTVQGVRVIVDAENRLLSITMDEEKVILAAYNAALADMRPQYDEATEELRADSRFKAISTFTEANTARAGTQQVVRQQQYQEDDDSYYEERNQRGWLV